MTHIALVRPVTLQLVTFHPETEKLPDIYFGHLWMDLSETFLGGLF